MLLEKIIPKTGYHLVKEIQREETTKSGLYIPNQKSYRILFGEVVKSGPGELTKGGERADSELVPGDKIHFLTSGANSIPGIKDHLLVREINILAKEQNEPADL